MTLGTETGSSFCTKKGQSQAKGVIGKERKETLEFCSAFQQKSPDMIVKDPATRETKSPHDLITWGHGYACVSTPSGPKWVPAKWVKPFIPKSAKPHAEAPQVASAAWRRRKCRTFSF
ncbi:hypothetical protein DUI87_31731 [Hirundo rustica rustica]|uniref:Integrase-type domain-containing protein n=1 Tax=Hirundo rustica rustica TaxID=333673 RepID=A0A3M0IZC0_HIRRU|nr:hypothetical protein DUI87_31731 [Hirundo rustica rustica]